MEKEYKRPEEESKSWNMSNDYVHELILKKIINIEKFRQLAIFGFSKIDFDLQITNITFRSQARIKSMFRLLDEIKSLLIFSEFTLKEKVQKESFKNFIIRLAKIEKNIPRLEDKNFRGNKLIGMCIYEDLFQQMISEISTMINKIIDLLNQSGIIFARTKIKNLSETVVDL